MSTASKNIVELKRVLAERFPEVKMSAGPPEALTHRWSTGLEQVDAALGGGLAKRAITEIVTSGVASGSLTLIAALLRQADAAGEWLALIDAADSFDPCAIDNQTLQRLLWLRCANAREAIKAADLVLHDGTPSVVVLDLAFCPLIQLRRTPSSTWFRLERLIENTSGALLILTPEAMVSNAETRLRLERRFSLDALDQPRDLLCARIATQSVKAAARIVKIA